MKAHNRGKLIERPQSNNQLRLEGVVEEYVQRKYSKTPYFRVHWTVLGRRKTKYFNIAKYGRETAKDMAITFRRKKEIEINEGRRDES